MAARTVGLPPPDPNSPLPSNVVQTQDPRYHPDRPFSGATRHVSMSGLPVGLTLRVDEYLTNLNQEIGMIRLDRRPTSSGPRGARCVDVVDRVLSVFSDVRGEIRRRAEEAFDRGQTSFAIAGRVPVESGQAARALVDALREIQLLSANGGILLPPLQPEAAEFFYVFLEEVARQVEGGSAPGATPTSRPPNEPLQLQGPHIEHLADAPARADSDGGTSRRAAEPFTRDVASAGAARRFVTDMLRSWGLGDVAQQAELPTAELVANALLHSAEEFLVVVRAGAHSVTVEVHDCERSLPSVRRRGNEADSGRGLLLVDATVDRWGFDERSELAKRVWFELSLPAHESQGGLPGTS